MPSARYEQVCKTDDAEGEESPPARAHNGRCSRPCVSKAVISLMLILLYFTLSIGLTFYQRWLLKGFHFPLFVVLYHLIVKFTLSAIIRGILFLYTGTMRVSLPFFSLLKNVAPTGIASGIDVGFSNWALELVTVSLYTMTKSTTIIFILLFAILFGLEKKSCSLVAIVVTISAGLTMFTYKATQFDMLGFVLLLLASLASGLRWTFAQVLMQKSKLGLNNPIDIVYYVQPWMLLSVLPFAVIFEGLKLINSIMSVTEENIAPIVFKVSFGAFLAFAMELSEYLVVTYTSSLTLSVAGIFKEIVILILAVELTGDQISQINVLGLVLCLVGISGHIVHKILNSNNQHHSTTVNYAPKFLDNYIVQESLDRMKGFEDRDLSVFRRNARKEHFLPLLTADNDNKGKSCDREDDQSEASEAESDSIIFDVMQRRESSR